MKIKPIELNITIFRDKKNIQILIFIIYMYRMDDIAFYNNNTICRIQNI